MVRHAPSGTCSCAGADSQAVADVCWETEEYNSQYPCTTAKGHLDDPNPPVGIPYTPTCFRNDVTVARKVNPAELHAVRCISASTQFGYSHCTLLNFQDANAFCKNFTGLGSGYTAGIADWRPPLTPLEAGRTCGSGCGYDISEIWVSFGAFSPQRSPRPSLAPV